VPAGPGRMDRAKVRKKRSEFLVDLRLRNELPDVPFDAKFLKIPSHADKLYGHKFPTLEQSYRPRIHLRPTIGLPIHLIDPRTAEVPMVPLSDADKYILRSDASEAGAGLGAFGAGMGAKTRFGAGSGLRNLQRAAALREGKHWLRKTEYIDNNPLRKGKEAVSMIKENEKRMNQLRKQQKLADSNKSMLTQEERVELSFEKAKLLPKHRTKPNLKPLKVWNVVPDLKMAANKLFHVSFRDFNILRDDQKAHAKKEAIYSKEDEETLSRAMLMTIHENGTEEDTEMISLLLPAGERSAKKRKREENGTKNEGKRDGFSAAANATSEKKQELAAGDEEIDALEQPGEKENEKKKGSISSSDSLSESDDDDAGGLQMKWNRDYFYQVTNFREKDKFALLWKKDSLEREAEPGKTIYDTVSYVELQPSVLTVSRNQTDKYDVKASRAKRIRLDKRGFDPDEEQEMNYRRTRLEAGNYSGDEEEEDEHVEMDAPETLENTKKSVHFLEKGSDKDDEEEEEEEEHNSDDGDKEEEKQPKEKKRRLSKKKESSDDDDDNNSSSSDSSSSS